MSGTQGGGRRRGAVMAQQWSQRLEKQLWPQGYRRDAWMIVDSARDPRIFGLLLESYLEYACLYSGFVPPALETAAPYLVRLEYEDRRSRLFLDHAWGNSWGVFLKCDTRLDSLRRHLRGFLTVQGPNGDRLLFRYYDPRVLRLYLPSCTGEDLRRVFGPIERFWTETESPDTLLTFGFDGSRLLASELPLDGAAMVPAVPPANTLDAVRKRPGMLVIRREQLSLFSQAELRKFEDWMVSHLGKFFPRQSRTMGESKLRETIQYGIKRAASYGIVSKRDVCKYVDVMIVLGRDFDRDPQYLWAARILGQKNSRQKNGSGAKAQALLESAIRHVRQSTNPKPAIVVQPHA